MVPELLVVVDDDRAAAELIEQLDEVFRAELLEPFFPDRLGQVYGVSRPVLAAAERTPHERVDRVLEQRVVDLVAKPERGEQLRQLLGWPSRPA